MNTLTSILIHGIHSKDPKDSVGKIGDYLDSFNIFDYGWHSFLSIIWTNKKDATKLLKVIKKCVGKVVLYAHSNGNPIGVEAAIQGAKIDFFISINAALKRNTIFPASCKHVLVIHTKNDIPTRAAKFFNSLPVFGIFVANAWGAMGAKGSNSLQPNVVNWDLTHILDGHSDFFEAKNLIRLMPHIKKWIDDPSYDIAEQERPHMDAMG